MKAGLSNNSIESLLEENNRDKEGITTMEINMFLDSVSRAKMMGINAGEQLPSMEANRKIIEYYNRENLAGFDEVGYFTFNGVNVYELGKKEEALKKSLMDMEEKNFGKPENKK